MVSRVRKCPAHGRCWRPYKTCLNHRDYADPSRDFPLLTVLHCIVQNGCMIWAFRERCGAGPWKDMGTQGLRVVEKGTE